MNEQIFWKKKTLFSYLLAVLVCIIHVQTLNNYTHLSDDVSFMLPHTWFVRLFCRVAVPAFFLLSGVLFFKDYKGFDSYKKKIKKRIHTLVIPYLSWNVIATIFGVITTIYFSQYFIGRAPTDMTFYGILKSIFLYSNNLQFWFIFFLIVFNFASPIVYVLLRNKYIGALVIVVALIISHWVGLPCYEPESHIYYMTGAYIGIHYFKWFRTSNRRRVVFGIIGIICMSSIRIFDFAVDCPSIKTVVLIIYALSFFFALGLLDDMLSTATMPDFLSHSFLIFALHPNCCSVFGKLLYFIFPKQIQFAWLNFILTLIFTLIFIELFAQFLKKYMPKINIILSGSRS